MQGKEQSAGRARRSRQNVAKKRRLRCPSADPAKDECARPACCVRCGCLPPLNTVEAGFAACLLCIAGTLAGHVETLLRRAACRLPGQAVSTVSTMTRKYVERKNVMHLERAAIVAAVVSGTGQGPNCAGLLTLMRSAATLMAASMSMVGTLTPASVGSTRPSAASADSATKLLTAAAAMLSDAGRASATVTVIRMRRGSAAVVPSSSEYSARAHGGLGQGFGKPAALERSEAAQTGDRRHLLGSREGAAARDGRVGRRRCTEHVRCDACCSAIAALCSTIHTESGQLEDQQ